MKVGMIGMGKLGLPVALAIDSRGHDVMGYDIAKEPYDYLEAGQIPYKEEGLQPLLDNNRVKMTHDLGELVMNSDIVFCPVQTPHDPKYEGVTRIPDTRADFDYEHLKTAVAEVALLAHELGKRTTLAVISTCLPGTFEREIRPLLTDEIDYVYTPLYIAMGTVLQDYLHPEYSLIGVDSDEAAQKLGEFYITIHDAPHVVTDVTTAEGIKVFYNTNITQKTILTNAHMQVAHKMGMNIDDINRAMMMSTDRIVSTKYMRSGGPDSGGCHPRDLIALSWLGEQIDMKPNWFEMMAIARELQTEWSADLIEEEHTKTGLPIYVMGKAFKPESNLTVGSGATLLVNMLEERGLNVVQWDPHVDTEQPDFGRGIYFVATEHQEFAEFEYPDGSTVLDLWRYLPENDKIRIVRIGNPNDNKTLQ